MRSRSVTTPASRPPPTRTSDVQTVVGATHTIRITAELTSTPAWKSVPANQVVNLPLIGLFPTCGASS